MEYCRIPSIIRGLSGATYRQEISWNKCILSAQFIFMWILWNLSNGIVRFTKILTFKSSIILDTKNEPRKVKKVTYIRFPVLSYPWPGCIVVVDMGLHHCCQIMCATYIQLLSHLPAHAQIVYDFFEIYLSNICLYKRVQYI